MDKFNQAKSEHPWYYTVIWAIGRWVSGYRWRRLQAPFKRRGTRYYGDGGTIHNTTRLSIETTEQGQVVAVWFRCQLLPFEQRIVSNDRAVESARAAAELKTRLCGVEVCDS